MYYQNYLRWKECVKDKGLLDELLAMDKEQIYNAFFKYIEFGTGGLRGKMGAGTNCINIYTIRKASQGIANYMHDNHLKSVAICYDNRNNSILFSRIAAEVFASCGYKVYITKQLMPTPFLSFTVRHTRADIGIMITASHNPAGYNGYKVYNSDGCQCTDAMASQLAGYIKNVDEFAVTTLDFTILLAENSIEYVSDSVEDEYIKNVLKQQINKINSLNVTFSPLHGTGYPIVPKVLRLAGVRAVNTVEEQQLPDGDFPTCKLPNPEKQEALALGLKYAQENNSELLLVTDPDCDRVGVAVLHKGKYFRLTGNEVGALLADYIFSEKKKKGTLVANPIVIKTIVTSDLGRLIAESFGAQVINVLTGFKYIGEQITILEKEGRSQDFVLGYEESYGYLIGDYVRDKDAVVSCLLIAEMVSTLQANGKTLLDRLNELYSKYGYFEHKLYSFSFEGAQGYKKMQDIMLKIRNNMPSGLGDESLVSFVDYLIQKQYLLPKSDVFELNFEKGSKIVIRPSGTEPLIKVYVSSCKDTVQNKATFQLAEEYINSVIA